MKPAVRSVALLSLWFVACAGPAHNPDRDSLAPVEARAGSEPRSTPAEPVASTPAPNAPGAKSAGSEATPLGADAQPAGDAAKPVASEPAVNAPATQASAPASKAPESAAAQVDANSTGVPKTEPAESPRADPSGAPRRLEPPQLAVAYVEGRALDVRRFLGRVWLRDSTFAREVLDELVVAELAIREADRLGIRIEPARVDAGVQRALDALARRLEDKGSKLTVEQHVRQNLGLDFTLYKSELERDALMQLLAERCVRAYALASERAVVRLAELPDRAAYDTFQAELAKGADFRELVAKLGTPEIKKSGDATMTLFQNDNSKLSRLVFATPTGSIGGPLEEGGRYLLVRVEERLAPKVGPWAEIGPLVEGSLASDPVDDLEYAQWKTHVGKVYDVDLQPFLELVGEKRP
ncbi:MAG: peptidyl-prolyl cis-trans isomerase [Planctomycetes bacterium]|nr:peptidyl-prolyl cis-trans isomerase [Planctomycetota bacterium]